MPATVFSTPVETRGVYCSSGFVTRGVTAVGFVRAALGETTFEFRVFGAPITLVLIVFGEMTAAEGLIDVGVVLASLPGISSNGLVRFASPTILIRVSFPVADAVPSV